MVKLTNKKGFTLIELLIVIGILAILATVAILVINPAELFREARDSKRLSELNTLNKALQIVEISIPGAPFGATDTVYVSLPDTSTTCSSYSLPSLPSGWAYNCETAADIHKTNGNGWVPVDFDAVPVTSLSTLPVDPVNDENHYYAYVTGGSWALSALFESGRHAEQAAVDGGPDPAQYEIGSDLTIAPFIRGMVGYWKFDGNRNDSSGNNNNGTIGGGNPVYRNCKVGQCLDFNGWSDYIIVPGNSIMNLSGGGTVMGWLKATSRGGGLSFSSGAGWVDERFVLYLGATNNLIGFAHANGSTYGTFYGGSVSPLNEWYHAAIVMDVSQNSKKIYLNGVLNGTSSGGAFTPGTINVPFYIGRTTGLYNDYFGGLIDEVRVYKRPLSANEISEIYDATK